MCWCFRFEPPEALLSELLEDDRICLHLATYKAALEHAMGALMSHPHVLWELCSGLCPGDSVTASSLRSEVMSCAHTALAFIGSRVWQRVEDWPWRLAVGDVAANVQSLADMDTPPEESVARKIWALANQNFPRVQLVEGVELLKHVGWSSTTVEQQHASAALVKRVHSGYEFQMICSRALLHTARLFYSIDPLDREEHKLQLQLQEQFDRKPKVPPPHAMLFKSAMNIYDAKAPSSRSPTTGLSTLTTAKIQLQDAAGM